MDRIRVVCADDNDFVREGMARIMESQADIECVAQAGEAGDVITAVLEHRPHVLVLDLRWGNDFGAGFNILRTVRRDAPSVKILAITAYELLATHAVHEDADAVVDKDIPRNELLNKIRELVQLPLDIVAARQHLAMLSAIEPGDQRAFRQHEECILKLLCVLFEPDLIRWDSQVRNVEGTQITDIVASNHSTTGFWGDVRQRHDARQIVFELKNVGELRNRHIEQVATQLGEPRGRLGFLVARYPPSSRRELAAEVPYRRDRKVILLLCDEDFESMVTMKAAKQDPAKKIQNLYDTFMLSL